MAKTNRQLFDEVSRLSHTSDEAFFTYELLKGTVTSGCEDAIIVTPTIQSAKSCFRYMAEDFLDGEINKSKLTIRTSGRTIYFIPITAAKERLVKLKCGNFLFKE